MAGDAAGPSVKPREAASARPQSETCLSGDHLFFADKQFDDARIAVLTANAQVKLVPLIFPLALWFPSLTDRLSEQVSRPYGTKLRQY